MKKTLSLFLLCAIAHGLWAQQFTSHRSSNTKQSTVQVLVSLDDGVDAKALEELGASVGTVAGNMATLTLPAERLADLKASGLCTYIEKNRQRKLYLDKVREDMHIDEIYRGMGLPQGYDGTGVVVGIIDQGFEYGHPTFYDTSGTVLRIKRVWQQADTVGTPPAEFTYGRELCNAEDILAAGDDKAGEGHGTHVAGIAAGCGAPDGAGRQYRGIAPGADIVLVSSTMNDASVFDAIHYIHSYARSVGKPCVINMSFGTQLGSHDGLTASDRALVNYVGETDSLVLVCAAGNSGNQKNHLYRQFSDTDTMVTTTLLTWPDDNFYNSVCIYGNEGDEYSASLALYDDASYTTPATLHIELPFIGSTVDTVYSFQITSPRDSVYYCDVTVTHTNPLNHRPLILIEMYKDGRASLSDLFVLTIKSTTAEVHAWSNSEFFSQRDDRFVNGDTDYTIGGEGGNTDVVISVGAYTTRTISDFDENLQFVTVNPGELMLFSSHGPTLDGRVKPDICAPGYCYSAYPETAITFMDDTVSANWGGERWFYALASGTSMSSPAVTGVIALWMQRTPSLNVASARELLHSTAYTDGYTGDIPATGSNLWGWGKVNAYAGLGGVQGIDDSPEYEARNAGFRVYVRDGNVVVQGAEGGEVSVYDIMGRLIKRVNVGIRKCGSFSTNALIQIPVSTFPSAGVYIVRLGERSQKIVINDGFY